MLTIRLYLQEYNYYHYFINERKSLIGYNTFLLVLQDHTEFTLIFMATYFLQDALLHAIKEEYVEAVELLLQWEEQNHVPGEPYVSQ